MAVFPMMAPADETHQGRFESVEKLLMYSSAAEQVIESDDHKALEIREQALQMFQMAKEAHQRGEHQNASQLLNAAAGKLFEAVRMVSQDGIERQKAADDLPGKRASVEALMEAHGRVSEEKGLQKVHKTLASTVDEKLQMADRQLAEGHEKSASRTIQEAYLLVKASLGNLRGGDTLVRELKFETPEEEYLYELDRNDTHNMLVVLLLNNKDINPSLKKLSEPYLDEAEDFRKKADKQASRKKFEAATDSLEKSTTQLVRAIRAAGVYIPN